MRWNNFHNSALVFLMLDRGKTLLSCREKVRSRIVGVKSCSTYIPSEYFYLKFGFLKSFSRSDF